MAELALAVVCTKSLVAFRAVEKPYMKNPIVPFFGMTRDFFLTSRTFSHLNHSYGVVAFDKRVLGIFQDGGVQAHIQIELASYLVG